MFLHPNVPRSALFHCVGWLEVTTPTQGLNFKKNGSYFSCVPTALPFLTIRTFVRISFGQQPSSRVCVLLLTASATLSALHHVDARYICPHVHEHTPNCLDDRERAGLVAQVVCSSCIRSARSAPSRLRPCRRWSHEVGQVRRSKAVPSHGFAPCRLTRIRLSTSAVFVSSVSMFT